MITSLPKAELVRIGSRLRGRSLVQQTGYTLGNAALEEAAIEALLGEPTLLEEVAVARDEVDVAGRDRDLAQQESKSLTGSQGAQMRKSRVWLRKVGARAARVRRQGREAVPEELTVVGRVTTVPGMLEALDRTLGMVEAHLTDLGGESARELLVEGAALHSALRAVDDAQEHARLAALPAKVRDYYAAKGLLYIGLKVINDAGQELHADDPPRAATYNLKILYRSGSRPRKGEPSAEPT